MKKLSILFVLSIVLCFSFAFATENVDLSTPPDNVTVSSNINDVTIATNSGETNNVSGENVEISENVSGENVEISGNVSGETNPDTKIPEENISGEKENIEDQNVKSSKSPIIGAILAIVIIIGIVAITAIISKKD